MRTINIPSSASVPQPIKVDFLYRFGSKFYGRATSPFMLVDDRPDSKDRNDAFIYEPGNISQACVDLAVQLNTAPGRDVKAAIMCSITVAGEMYNGLSFCYSGDVWSRKTGERYALRRALQELEKTCDEIGQQPLDSGARGKVWAAWLESYDKPEVRNFTADYSTPPPPATKPDTTMPPHS